MLARDIMTPDPVCATPQDSVQKVATLMRDRHFGCLPVVTAQDNRSLLGIVTDRDLAVRVLAAGRPLDTPVGEVMSSGVSCCQADTRVEDVEEIMMQRQVRRVPVVDATGVCTGIVAMGDVARTAVRGQEVKDSEVGRLIERVSAAAEQARSDVEIGVYPDRLRRATAQPERWPEGSRAPREFVT